MPHPMRVVAQRQTEKVLEDGEVHSVVSVALLIGRYGPFTLDVPVDQYHAENVVAMARDMEYRAGTIAWEIEHAFEEQGPGQGPMAPAPPPSPKPEPPPAV